MTLRLVVGGRSLACNVGCVLVLGLLLVLLVAVVGVVLKKEVQMSPGGAECLFAVSLLAWRSSLLGVRRGSERGCGARCTVPCLAARVPPGTFVGCPLLRVHSPAVLCHHSTQEDTSYRWDQRPVSRNRAPSLAQMLLSELLVQRLHVRA